MNRALGRYELLRPLARGGMAEVFLARRRAAGVEKWLVVKRMRPERAGDARFLDLFVREARLSMSLAHQNIVPVFDFGRIDDQVFLAMERVEGRDLGSSLAKAAPLAPLCAAFVAAECCQALDYAHLRRGPDGHALGIVHRDVTPRNVLLSWSGEVKLTDFGIAALAGDDSSKVIGTPAYMAPEQARGEPVDVRADVYAVGLILREALTGARARRGEDRESTLAAARSGELDAWPSAIASSASVAPLVAIADRATAAEPSARYADARAMLAALDAYIVTERAQHAVEAPARQLAAWLETTWGADREAGDASGSGDMAIEGSQLVSFLDDGALDVIGTGTARSMAATAADDAAAEKKAVDTAPAPIAQPAKSRLARDLAIAGGVALAGAVIFAVVHFSNGASEAAPSQPPQPQLAMQRTHPDDSSTKPDPTPKPAPIAKPEQLADVKPDPTPKPAHLDPKPQPVTKPARLDPKPQPVTKPAPAPMPAAASSAQAAQATQARRVIVNVAPGWAYFTVDGDPSQFQTLAAIALPAGAHVIHFTQGATHRDVPITVPDDDQLKVLVDLSR